VELEPGFIKAHVRLARAFCELGDFDTAATKLACACALQPLEIELQREYQVRRPCALARPSERERETRPLWWGLRS
jgi:hypothetical protein